MVDAVSTAVSALELVYSVSCEAMRFVILHTDEEQWLRWSLVTGAGAGAGAGADGGSGSGSGGREATHGNANSPTAASRERQRIVARYQLEQLKAQWATEMDQLAGSVDVLRHKELQAAVLECASATAAYACGEGGRAKQLFEQVRRLSVLAFHSVASFEHRALATRLRILGICNHYDFFNADVRPTLAPSAVRFVQEDCSAAMQLLASDGAAVRVLVDIPLVTVTHGGPAADYTRGGRGVTVTSSGGRTARGGSSNGAAGSGDRAVVRELASLLAFLETRVGLPRRPPLLALPHGGGPAGSTAGGGGGAGAGMGEHSDKLELFNAACCGPLAMPSGAQNPHSEGITALRVGGSGGVLYACGTDRALTAHVLLQGGVGGLLLRDGAGGAGGGLSQQQQKQQRRSLVASVFSSFAGSDSGSPTGRSSSGAGASTGAGGSDGVRQSHSGGRGGGAAGADAGMYSLLTPVVKTADSGRRRSWLGGGKDAAEEGRLESPITCMHVAHGYVFCGCMNGTIRMFHDLGSPAATARGHSAWESAESSVESALAAHSPAPVRSLVLVLLPLRCLQPPPTPPKPGKPRAAGGSTPSPTPSPSPSPSLSPGSGPAPGAAAGAGDQLVAVLISAGADRCIKLWTIDDGDGSGSGKGGGARLVPCRQQLEGAAGQHVDVSSMALVTHQHQSVQSQSAPPASHRSYLFVGMHHQAAQGSGPASPGASEGGNPIGGLSEWVSVWCLDTRRRLLLPPSARDRFGRTEGHTGAITAMEATPAVAPVGGRGAGRLLFTGSYDATICVWDLSAALACADGGKPSARAGAGAGAGVGGWLLYRVLGAHRSVVHCLCLQHCMWRGQAGAASGGAWSGRLFSGADDATVAVHDLTLLPLRNRQAEAEAGAATAGTACVVGVIDICQRAGGGARRSKPLAALKNLLISSPTGSGRGSAGATDAADEEDADALLDCAVWSLAATTDGRLFAGLADGAIHEYFV